MSAVRLIPPDKLKLPATLLGRVIAATAVVVVIAGVATLWRLKANDSASIVAGKVNLEGPVFVASDHPPHIEPSPSPIPSPSPPPPGTARVRSGGGGVPAYVAPREQGLWPPDGTPPGPAKAFTDPVDDSGGLQFVLVLGSDARAGNPDRGARADSIHVLALDPKARKGTIVGFPRDSWVNIPGSGTHKINDCLGIGGAALCVRTIRELTGMPVQYYVVTGFQGFEALVDAVGGVDSYVPYDMNEKNSGAFFKKGWHKMTGPKALSFSRNRHVPGGDLGRSENQGRLMLDALKKFRAETSSRADLEKLVGLLMNHVRLEMSMADAVRLASLARVTAASDVRNVVTPGRPGNAGRASVVFLSDQAPALFRDVAADARADGNYGALGPPEVAGGDVQATTPATDPAQAPTAPSPEPSPTPPSLIPGLPIPPLLPGP
jgi:LCP family protein required for cell wall assembly